MRWRPITRVIAAVVLTTASISGVIAPALAREATAAPSRTVHFEDLDLSTHRGVEVLYARIQNAARTLCGPSEDAGTRHVSEEWKDCVSATVRSAVLSINRPALTAYYAARLRTRAVRTPLAIRNQGELSFAGA